MDAGEDDIDALSPPVNGFTKLMHAVYWSDKVSKFIADGADPNIQGESGRTALTLVIHHFWGTPVPGSCFHTKRKVVKILLNAGADPNLRTMRGFCPLTYALRDMWCVITVSLVKALICGGADVNILLKRSPISLPDKECNSAFLHFSRTIKCGTAGITVATKLETNFHVLIQGGADVSMTDKHGKTSLYNVIRCDDMIEYFVSSNRNLVTSNTFKMLIEAEF